jgi:hypothetical protein
MIFLIDHLNSRSPGLNFYPFLEAGSLEVLLRFVRHHPVSDHGGNFVALQP